MPRASGSFQLHLVTEPKSSAAELLRAVELAVSGGVDWVQLRDKQASALVMHRHATELLRIVRDGGARLSINDRLDVALAVEADGVHLAGQSLPVAPAKHLAHGKLLVGRSVHSRDEAFSAAEDGADYVTFGHIFPSTSKPGMPPHGLQELADVVNAVDVPVIAIGGITADNLDNVLETGAAGIAVISAILSDISPGNAARRLRDALDASPHQPRRSLFACISS
jgi:thiamine-phosphate diphosphorylase